MSIMERYSPLNLSYKIIVVTNASSPLGIVVCNTLLKSNALVLGTDSKPKDASLSEGAYTHFQFHQCDLADGQAASDIVEYAGKKYKTERIDGVVNIASADDSDARREGQKKLALACAKKMIDGGTIVNTLLNAAESTPEAAASSARKSVADLTKELSSAQQKVRCNMIAPDAKDVNATSCKEYEEAKKLMGYLHSPSLNPNIKAPEAGPEKSKMFELSNVALFLSTEMSQSLNGVVLTPEGNRT